MILGFKQQFPWGGQTFFKEKILHSVGLMCNGGRIVKYNPYEYIGAMGKKFHTMREDPYDRWKPGMSSGILFYKRKFQ